MFNKEKIKFNSAEEMLERIQEGSDFYNPEYEEYVFVYNDCGSVCSYTINEDEAKELMERSNESGEYWSAYLGWGGGIYEDPSHEDYDEDRPSNLDYCKDVYMWDGWIDVTPQIN
jgi:hypothetical protein